jgi:hypothetical protein
MGKFLNHINKNNVIEIDALASLLGGKGKKYIMKMYGFTPEQADEVIKAKQTITDISAELAKKEASEIVLPKNYLESLLVKFFGIDPEKEEIYFEKHEDGIKVEHRPIGGKRIHLDHEKVIEEVKADGGHTDAEIAKKYGVTRGAIYYIRKQNGICKSRKLNDDIIKNIMIDMNRVKSARSISRFRTELKLKGRRGSTIIIRLPLEWMDVPQDKITKKGNKHAV